MRCTAVGASAASAGSAGSSATSAASSRTPAPRESTALDRRGGSDGAPSALGCACGAGWACGAASSPRSRGRSSKTPHWSPLSSAGGAAAAGARALRREDDFFELFRDFFEDLRVAPELERPLVPAREAR